MYNFKQAKFAGTLKDMLKSLGLTHEHLEGNLKERPCELLGGHTPRHAMQTLGTEWGRNLIVPDLWVRAWTYKVQTLLSQGVSVVCDDCRFDNEVQAVQNLGGVVCHISRGEEFHATGADHPSEMVPEKFDVEIYNFGKFDELNWQLNRLVK
jgi:hypothetical protein